MKLVQAARFNEVRTNFDVLETCESSQLAAMVMGVGESSGEYGNEHAGSEQTLFVISGEGEAIVEGESHRLNPGDTIVLEKGEKHQIKNTGSAALRT